MEIKVGEYVRTKDGVIGKITKIVTDSIFYVQFYDNEPWKTDIEEAGVVKSSPNIIDLIEVGDYVNDFRVVNFVLNDGNKIGITVDSDFWAFDADEIRTIVTHEQMREMEYKV